MAKSLTSDLSEHYGKKIDKLEDSICPDGFLNIGHWDGIALDREISVADRIKSGRALYRKVLDSLDIVGTDRLLEIGCGRGRGAALAFQEFHPAAVHGIDLVAMQIDRARMDNADIIARAKGRLEYRQGSAAAIPYQASHFDKVFSLEAMVHFPDLEKFTAEVVRVTRRPARVTIASVFAPSPSITLEQWLSLPLPYEGTAMLYAHPVALLTETMMAHGFVDLIVESIGEHVWRGFDRFLAQTDSCKRSRMRNWLVGFERGLLDYYVITAKLDS